MDFQSSLSNPSLTHPTYFSLCKRSWQKPVPFSTETPGLTAPQLIAGHTALWFGDQVCKELLPMPSPVCVLHNSMTTTHPSQEWERPLGFWVAFLVCYVAPPSWPVGLHCFGAQQPLFSCAVWEYKPLRAETLLCSLPFSGKCLPRFGTITLMWL